MDDVYCFGGNPLDRASERRDDGDWIAKLLGDPDTRLLALRDLKPFTRGTTVPALDWQPVAQWRDQIDTGAPLIFLGLGDGTAHSRGDPSALETDRGVFASLKRYAARPSSRRVVEATLATGISWAEQGNCLSGRGRRHGGRGHQEGQGFPIPTTH